MKCFPNKVNCPEFGSKHSCICKFVNFKFTTKNCNSLSNKVKNPLGILPKNSRGVSFLILPQTIQIFNNVLSGDFYENFHRDVFMNYVCSFYVISPISPLSGSTEFLLEFPRKIMPEISSSFSTDFS